MENGKQHDKEMENSIKMMLEHIGENPNRDGLIDTPQRVVKMWKEIFRGYDLHQKPNITTFNNGSDGIIYDQMICDEGTFHSHCEHHIVPFFGHYYFSYIPSPKGKLLGLSKVARVVDYYSAKLQVQERLVKEIVECLWDELSKDDIEPLGMALVMKAEHLCKTMRGVKKKGLMTSSIMKGVFMDKPEVRAEFMNMINRGQ